MYKEDFPMKPIHIVSHQNGNMQSTKKAATNSESLSQQIESLRLVLRRMKTNETAKRDSFISQKLQGL